MKRAGLTDYVEKIFINNPTRGLFSVEMDFDKSIAPALYNDNVTQNKHKSNVTSRFRYVVYDYDLESEEELDSLKSFSSGRKDAAIKYAQKYAKEHADEGLGVHVVIIPDDEDDEEVLEYFEYELGGVEPYETVWTSY